MHVIFESDSRLRIELNEEDLRDLGVTVEELDYASPKTRRVLTELLTRIGAEEMLAPGGRRLVEVLPLHEGGCVISFTALAQRAPVTLRQRQAGVWAFPDAEAVMAAAQALAPLSPQNRARLYRFGTGYRLVLPAQSRAQEHLLKEFAAPVEDEDGRMTAEHGRLLTDRLFSVLPTGRPPRGEP